MTNAAAELARLEVRTDAVGVRETDAELRRLESTIGRVEGATGKLDDREARRARAQRNRDRQQAEYVRWATQVQKQMALLEQYTRLLEMREMALAASFAQTSRAANDNARAVAAAARAHGQLATSTTSANAAIRTTSTTVQTATGTFNRFGGVMQNAGLQIGDLAVQIASGGGFLRPLIQQGTQFVSMFGPWGAVLGAAGAVVGAFATTLLGAGEGASQAEKAADRYKDVVSEVDRTIQTAIASGKELRTGLVTESTNVEDLTRHYAALSTTMREVEAIRLTALGNQAREAIAGQRAAVAGLLDDVEDAAELSRRMSEVGGQMPIGGQPDDVLRMVEALDAFKAAAPDDVEALGRLAVALDDVAKSGGPFAAEARKAADALADPATKAVELAEKLKLLDGNMAVLRGTATKSQVALLNLGSGTSKVTLAAAKLADQRAETIAGLQVELQQQTELRKAHEQGAIAVDAVTDAQDAYAVIHKLKLAADSEEARQIIDLVVKINDQKRAIEGITDAQKETAEQAKRTAADQKRAAEEAQREYEKVVDSIANTTQEKLGDVTFDYLQGKTVDFATFLKDTLLRSVADVIAAIATQQIAIPIITSAVGVAPGLFGLTGQAAGVAQQAAGAGGAAGVFAPITNALSSFFSPITNGLANVSSNFAAGGIGSVLVGSAPVDISGGLGAIVAPGSQGLLGSGGAFSLGAAAPWIAAAAAIAIPLLSGMFGGSPSVGDTSVARVTDLSRPEDAVFTFDNGGSDTGVLTGVIKAVSKAIESGTERFLGTVRAGSGFDFGYFPSPESGNSQAAGINLKPIIANVLEDRDRFKGLSEQEAIDKATLIALQEMVDYQSATLDEIAKNSEATTAAELIADLEFGQNFDRLNTALDALGGAVTANTLAQAQNTVAIQARADEFRTTNVNPIVDGLEKALTLFPGLATGTVTTSQSVRGVNVPITDEGRQVDSRFVEEGTSEFDRLVSGGAEIVSQVREITEAASGRSANFAANLERVADAIRIANGSVDLLVQTVTGEFEPAISGPFGEALAQGTANLRAAGGGFEALNEQIREAYRNFPELASTLGPLNDVLIDVTSTVNTAIETLRASLREQFEESLLARRNAATGLGGVNDIQALVRQRDVDRSEAAALGSDVALVNQTFGDELRSLLRNTDIGDLGRIIGSGQITDADTRAILDTVLAEQALAAARQIELTNLQSLTDQTKAFASAANDNARALRQAAAGFAVNADLSILSPFERLEEARRQFETAYAAANDNDPTDTESQRAIDQLPSLSEQLLTASKAYYSTNSNYVADYTRVQEALASTAVRQEDIERDQLTALRSIEQRIVELGGVLANDNGAKYVRGGDGQYTSTGAGGLPAGLDLGYDAERNIRVYQAYQAVGATYRGAGEGQIGQDRASNPALHAILTNLGFAEGGMVAGGIPGRDSVPAWLMPGERVLTVDQNAIFERMAATLNAWAPIVSELRALRQDFAEAANDTEELGDKVERLITVTYSTGTATAEGVRQGNDQRGRMIGTAERDAAKPAGRKVS